MGRKPRLQFEDGVYHKDSNNALFEYRKFMDSTVLEDSANFEDILFLD